MGKAEPKACRRESIKSAVLEDGTGNCLTETTGWAYAPGPGGMDEATTLVLVGALVLLVGAGRLLIAMLGGGGDAARMPRASFPPVRHVGRRAGASALGRRVSGKTVPGIGRVGRLADDEVRRALDDLKGKAPPRR